MRTLDRFGALTGAGAIAVGIIGSDVLGTPPGPQDVHPTGQQDLVNLHWVATNAGAQVGVSLELASFTLLILFVGYVATRVRGAGWLAAAAFGGGVIEIAIKVGSGAPMLAAYLLRDEISPQTARVLIDMNGVAFVLTWIPMGIFIACASAAAMATGNLGRVLGWGGVVVGAATTITTVATGVHVLSAIFVPFVLCLLWILVVSVKWGFAREARAQARVVNAELSVGT